MANQTITYEDLSLSGLIEYYEAKKGPRAKMTLSYLKEVREVHEVINGSGTHSPARNRLMEMRKHPARQSLFAKALAKKNNCKECGVFPCKEHSEAA